MELVLAWQIAVALSVIVARAFSPKAMIMVALCWTAFTLLAVWAHWLVLLQLGTAWGTVWLLSKLFGKRAHDKEASPQAASGRKLISSPNGAPVEGLILELLATGQMREDTRQDLNRFLGEARAGRLHADDWEYVRDLHARTCADSLVESAEIGLSTRDGNHVAMPGTSPIGAVAKTALAVEGLASAAATAATHIEQAVGRLDNYVTAQREKQEANGELSSQLRRLRLYLESALESGERTLDIAKRYSENAEFAKHHARLSALFPDLDEKRELVGVMLQPVDRSSLPKLAIEERLTWLREALIQLDQSRVRVERDAVLLAATNSKLTIPFEQFITEQSDLLRRHISLLSPPAQASSRTTVVKSVSDAFSALATVSKSDGAPQSQAVFANGDVLEEFTNGLRRESIERLADEHRIPHLVHFTRCENLSSILQYGLMSVAESKRRGLGVVRNDDSRWDGQLDGTSLSIAFPNYRMFYKYRQVTPSYDWAVLLISPRVLWETDCAFYRYNAADGRMSRRPRAEMQSVEALSDMFASDEARDPYLRPCDPTDPQAEVMVYETIEPGLIEAAAFETAEARDRHLPHLRGLESFYAGAGRGLFAARRSILAN